MSLLDLFRRTPDAEPPAHVAELYRKVGRLDAAVDGLELKWETYRDELRRLVQRLEKRDQRASASEVARSDTNGDGVGVGVPHDPDPITSAIHARRRARRHVS